ncbi:putative RING finger domain protein [Cladophialophora carrionii]|uniref:Putative RING finger domain protein n=1 Tax=Cladophialophora carrionii TaxID=86049 RepID=A0A1C1CQR9_9EURO|nr:putative RING finger domain protein [Cladophialophora carrionii]
MLSLFGSRAAAQTIAPSNSTQDLFPSSTSPRFIMNGTEFSNIPVVRLAPLGRYAEMSHDNFLRVEVEGHLVNVDASNANDIAGTGQFSYISCDPEDYPGNLDASQVFRIVVNSPRANIVILYSETSDHCIVTGLDTLPNIGGILTTTDTMLASSLAALSLTEESPGTATILPDLNSYTNSSSPGWGGNGGLGNSPTTAVAMIILYSITGIITALFVVIIVTGAVRAHRHPERYGPRNIVGRGRQSRARGIARAMLETLPIVKFGDHQDLPPKPAEGSDIEMNAGSTHPPSTDNTESANKAVAGEVVTSETQSDRAQAMIATANPDGTDAEGHLGCSICTEDFKKGEEVRVLPCNHKFHPDCVDPWLLNVSGTCPLCRIDLRPLGQEIEGEERRGSTATTDHDGQLPPPLPAGAADSGGTPYRGGRRETIANLRHLAHGSRAERIAALRQMRIERLGSNSDQPANDEERSGLARRFRERFRIRTERRGATAE